MSVNFLNMNAEQVRNVDAIRNFKTDQRIGIRKVGRKGQFELTNPKTTRISKQQLQRTGKLIRDTVGAVCKQINAGQINSRKRDFMDTCPKLDQFVEAVSVISKTMSMNEELQALNGAYHTAFKEYIDSMCANMGSTLDFDQISNYISKILRIEAWMEKLPGISEYAKQEKLLDKLRIAFAGAIDIHVMKFKAEMTSAFSKCKNDKIEHELIRKYESDIQRLTSWMSRLPQLKIQSEQLKQDLTSTLNTLIGYHIHAIIDKLSELDLSSSEELMNYQNLKPQIEVLANDRGIKLQKEHLALKENLIERIEKESVIISKDGVVNVEEIEKFNQMVNKVAAFLEKFPDLRGYAAEVRNELTQKIQCKLGIIVNGIQPKYNFSDEEIDKCEKLIEQLGKVKLMTPALRDTLNLLEEDMESLRLVRVKVREFNEFDFEKDGQDKFEELAEYFCSKFDEMPEVPIEQLMDAQPKELESGLGPDLVKLSVSETSGGFASKMPSQASEAAHELRSVKIEEPKKRGSLFVSESGLNPEHTELSSLQVPTEPECRFVTAEEFGKFIVEQHGLNKDKLRLIPREWLNSSNISDFQLMLRHPHAYEAQKNNQKGGDTPEPWGSGVSSTFKVRDRNRKTIFIYKPSKNESKNNNDEFHKAIGIPVGTGYIREILAYKLDKSVKGTSCAGVPPTGLASFDVNGELSPGSAQMFYKKSKTLYESPLFKTNLTTNVICEMQRIAILDIRILNGDRHEDNILVHDGHLIPIDHGRSFPEKVVALKFAWMKYEHVKQPIDPQALKFINDIEVEKDIKLCKGISKDATDRVCLSTLFLKRCANQGLTLYDIARIMLSGVDRNKPAVWKVRGAFQKDQDSYFETDICSRVLAKGEDSNAVFDDIIQQYKQSPQVTVK